MSRLLTSCSAHACAKIICKISIFYLQEFPFIMDLERLKSMDQKNYTLALILHDNQVLLGMKKRGFGQGKWNGFGGKPLQGETLLQAAVREIHEECGLQVEQEDLTLIGIIYFEFVGNPVLMKTHIYRCEKFQGEATESCEMQPQWYPVNRIPLDQMWADDGLWWPLFLQSTKFIGYCHFEGHEKMLSYVFADFDKHDRIIKSMNL